MSQVSPLSERDDHSVMLVLVTCGSREEGATLAKACVTEGLAACVNLIPQVVSFYQWEGHLQQDEECLLLLKTDQASLQGLERRIQALHSYDVPEFIALPITSGSRAYLDWIQGALRSRP